VPLIELTGEASYEAEVDQCVGVTGYHRWFFLTALAEAFGMRMRAFAVDADGERLGVVPLLFRRRGPVSTANFLPVMGTGPVLRAKALDAGRAVDLVRAVEPVLLRERAVVTKWSFAPGLEVNLNGLARHGFDIGAEDSYAVPGALSIDGYLKGLSHTYRRKIRGLERHGLHAEPSTRADILDWLPPQISRVHRGQGIASDYSLPVARALMERLVDHPRMRWCSVRNSEGQLLALNACIIDENRLWGWQLAGEPVPGPSPHMAACWDGIQWALSQGLGYDFGAATSEGNRNFKVWLGGELEHCATAERVRPRFYRTGRDAYARLASRRARRAEGKAASGTADKALQERVGEPHERTHRDHDERRT
jgi:CelD/BcsL family acetyltransferase involved in cellulose biosynthesis